MNTKEFQHRLLKMIKMAPTSAPVEEDYFKHLEHSIELEIARDISVWWRCLQIEKYCILTSNLLKLQNQFDEEVRVFYFQHNVSPYIEVASMQFLEHITATKQGLLHTVASFEKNLIQLKRKQITQAIVEWDYEPYAILDILLRGKPFEVKSIQGSYQTIMGMDIEHYFTVVDNANDEDVELV